MAAAMVRAGSSVPRIAPKSISLPTRGSIGSSASTLPMGVSTSCSMQECAKMGKHVVHTSIQKCAKIDKHAIYTSIQECARMDKDAGM